MMQLNKRLFPHYQEEQLYFAAANKVFQCNDELLVIEEANEPIISIERPFIQFYNTVGFKSKFYEIFNENLIEFDKLKVTTIAKVPESSEKYKLAVFSNNLYSLNESGRVFCLKDGIFEPSEISFLKGDSYIFSHVLEDFNAEIAVNLTSNLLNFKHNQYIVQQELPQLLIVDLINPFYILLHDVNSNLLVDLTTRGAAFDIYYTQQREKALDWNRVGQGLRLLRDIYCLSDEYLAYYQQLDAAALGGRILALLGIQQRKTAPPAAPEPRKLESNEIWTFGDPKPQQEVVLTDMRGNIFKAKGFGAVGGKQPDKEAGKAARDDGETGIAAPAGNGLEQLELFEARKAERGDSSFEQLQKTVIKQQSEIDELKSVIAKLQSEYYAQQDIINKIVENLDEKAKSAVLNAMIDRVSQQ